MLWARPFLSLLLALQAGAATLPRLTPPPMPIVWPTRAVQGCLLWLDGHEVGWTQIRPGVWLYSWEYDESGDAIELRFRSAEWGR